MTLALGGDCLADLALLRAEPSRYRRVASDPTLSRTITALAADPTAALKAQRGPLERPGQWLRISRGCEPREILLRLERTVSVARPPDFS
jgi:hypothetical protein